MDFATIAVVSPGVMGHVVGRVLTEKGYRVITLLEGRSDLTRERAARSGMEGVADMNALVSEADMVLSILPPESATALARSVADAMASAGQSPVYVDCNAISPATSKTIADMMTAAGATFINVGIVGPPPNPAGNTKFYASGPDAELIQFMDGEQISVRQLGADISRAAAMKMCYAGLTKGTFSLHTAVLLTAELLGIGPEFHAELMDSQKNAWEAMNRRVPFLAADAGRWSGEMDEIAATFSSVGITPSFHKGASEIFRLLDASPFGVETRETQDKNRTLDQAIEVYAETARGRKAAE